MWAFFISTKEDHMANKKIIAVAGATGAQGGGLVRAILGDPNGGFAARALTRDVNSDKAKALAKLGAEVVAADLDDDNVVIVDRFGGTHRGEFFGRPGTGDRIEWM